MKRVPSATCANCNRTIYEGERAMYDDATDNYFCAKPADCFDEWYFDNLADYKRRNTEQVDL